MRLVTYELAGGAILVMDADSPHEIITQGSTVEGGEVGGSFGHLLQAQGLAREIHAVAERLQAEECRCTRRVHLLCPKHGEEGRRL